MADLLGKAIGGLGGGALNSLTNGIHPKNIMLVSLPKFQLFCYCVVSSEFLILAFLLVLPSIELRLSKIYRLSASIDGLVNGTVDTALNYTWRLNLNYEFHKKKLC